MSDPPQAQPDPQLEAAVDTALDEYRDVLPTPVIADMSELLREELARHPVSARLLRQLAPAPVVQRSADVAHGEEEEAQKTERKDARARGRR